MTLLPNMGPATESLRSNSLPQVERAVAAGSRVGDIEEAPVDAVECGARSLVRALDGERAHRQRSADCLHSTVTVPCALCPLEEVDVDLSGEHLLQTAHVLRAGALVTVRVEKWTAELDAPARVDRLVAEGAALTALSCFVNVRSDCHLGEV